MMQVGWQCNRAPLQRASGLGLIGPEGPLICVTEVFKDSKVTAYFQNVEKKTDKPVGINNNDEDAIFH